MHPILFLVLAVLLIGGAFYLVALPIVQRTRRVADSPSLTSEQEHLDDLLADRDAAFQALRELAFDHRVGKITDEDFVAFEAHLKRGAAQTLRALDAWEGEADTDLDAEMERAIRRRKAGLSGAGARDLDGRACPECGRAAASSDRFCGTCGASLSPVPAASSLKAVTLSCANCGQPYQPGDKFCAGCGHVLIADGVAQRAG